MSLLLDQLFSLKAVAGVGTPKMKKEPTILSDIVCSSDLLSRLEKHLASHPQKRGEDLLASLRAYEMESKPLHHRYQRRKKIVKGKAPLAGLQIPDELHAHKMSLISQVQDLFPDLGSAFVVRLLDVYGDNPETVVAHLLDDSLSPELQTLDRSEQLPPPSEPQDSHLAPRPTPPTIPSPAPAPVPARRNVFDSDVDIAELSRTDEAKGKLHFGRADEDLTADTVLADRSQHSTNKAAILSALALFDSDDDERDDTYDSADVGGTVDGATAGDVDTPSQENMDMVLFRAYKSDSGLFARDSATRRSQPRASLKRETNMTDEAIEGWAVMLSRDPKRLSRLENQLADDAGGVGGVLSTSRVYPRPRTEGRIRRTAILWKKASLPVITIVAGEVDADADAAGENNPVAHKRKEENKASRANHNRRQQRAKKIARGGGLPG
ncbi:hypothetical protein N7512_006007 [Penicillium capsulatum]|nr:hypothetical protein N7512_006007 [Penicillium capsulatum]